MASQRSSLHIFIMCMGVAACSSSSKHSSPDNIVAADIGGIAPGLVADDPTGWQVIQLGFDGSSVVLFHGYDDEDDEDHGGGIFWQAIDSHGTALPSRRNGDATTRPIRITTSTEGTPTAPRVLSYYDNDSEELYALFVWWERSPVKRVVGRWAHMELNSETFEVNLIFDVGEDSDSPELTLLDSDALGETEATSFSLTQGPLGEMLLNWFDPTDDDTASFHAHTVNLDGTLEESPMLQIDALHRDSHVGMSSIRDTSFIVDTDESVGDAGEGELSLRRCFSEDDHLVCRDAQSVTDARPSGSVGKGGRGFGLRSFFTPDYSVIGDTIATVWPEGGRDGDADFVATSIAAQVYRVAEEDSLGDDDNGLTLATDEPQILVDVSATSGAFLSNIYSYACEETLALAWLQHDGAGGQAIHVQFYYSGFLDDSEGPVELLPKSDTDVIVNGPFSDSDAALNSLLVSLGSYYDDELEAYGQGIASILWQGVTPVGGTPELYLKATTFAGTPSEQTHLLDP